MDLNVEEVRRRFYQDGVKTAALWEQVVFMADRKEQTVNVDSQHLSLHFDRDWLETQLKMFEGVLGDSPGNIVQDVYKRCLSYHMPSNLGCIT